MPVVQGSSQSVLLPAGQQLTLVANAVSSGRVWPFTERVGDSSGYSAVAAGATMVLGPFSAAQRYHIEVVSGSLTYTIAQAAQMPVLGTLGDVVDIVGAGAPTDSVTGANVAGIGSRYVNTTNGKLYLNGGTKAAPVWKIVTSA